MTTKANKHSGVAYLPVALSSDEQHDDQQEEERQLVESHKRALLLELMAERDIPQRSPGPASAVQCLQLINESVEVQAPPEMDESFEAGLTRPPTARRRPQPIKVRAVTSIEDVASAGTNY
jgi:hypothetical protein